MPNIQKPKGDDDVPTEDDQVLLNIYSFSTNNEDRLDKIPRRKINKQLSASNLVDTTIEIKYKTHRSYRLLTKEIMSTKKIESRA